MHLSQNNMIELRWYIMSKPNSEVKILQYRQVVRDIVTGATSWTEWADVPDYKEDFSS